MRAANLFASLFLSLLFGCAFDSDEPYSLNYQSATYFVDFSDSTEETVKKIVIQKRGIVAAPDVFSLTSKSSSGFSYDTTTSVVKGRFEKSFVDTSILCGDAQLYSLILIYAESETSITLKGTRVPCEG